MKEMKVRLEGKARVRAPLIMRSMMIVFRNKITQTLCDKSLVYICTAIFNWTTNLKCYVHHQQISGNECQTKSSLRASSPIWASEAPRGFAARSRVLARLVLLAQIGELARRLDQEISRVHSIYSYSEIRTIEPTSLRSSQQDFDALASRL